MHEYMKRVRIDSNLSNYNYVSVTSILNFINFSVKGSYAIPNLNELSNSQNDNYELLLHINKLKENSKTLILTLEIYDGEVNNIKPKDAISLFETEAEFRNFITMSIMKYIDEINNLKITFPYFSNGSIYDIHNDKLYAAVYDFKTNQFLPIPEVNEAIFILGEPNIDALLESIMKDD